MRVLHIGKFFPPHPGGIERTSADLCAGLTLRNIDVAMLAHAEPGELTSTSANVERIAVTRAACFGQLLFAPVSPTFPLLLKKILSDFRPDLLHLHVPNTSAFWALLSSAAKRVPWIVHWHGDIPLDSQHAGLRFAYGIYRPWEQALLRRSTSIIATSPDYADSSEALRPWRSKVNVIPLGIADIDLNAEPETADRIRWPDSALRVLAVGRLSYFKGFDVLLRAIAKVPDASLVLIGDGECAGDLRRLAANLGIESRVNFVGRVDVTPHGQARLATAYASADIFCLPSTERAESFGLVLLEAMRAGVATIASAIPGSGVNHVVRDGETGLMVRPGDPVAIADAICRLRDDVELRRRLGAAGRRRFVEEFMLDSSVDRTLSLYRKILAKPHPAAAAQAS
jgi:glycosyltransferase involved in cell wall biosynthesis